MLVTAQNIKQLDKDTLVWVVNGFTIPERYSFIGVGSSTGYYIFITDNKLLKVFVNNPDSNNEIHSGRMFTDYDEAIVKMREQCLNTIDHYNKHQLKNNPIIVKEQYGRD
jgi:hypothetical protein